LCTLDLEAYSFKTGFRFYEQNYSENLVVKYRQHLHVSESQEHELSVSIVECHGSVSFVQILVHGTVLCRRGVLMLTADNVTIYGGEVDSLNETSQQQLVTNKLYVSQSVYSLLNCTIQYTVPMLFS